MGSSLNETVGALLIAVLVTAVGFGITTMQTYTYIVRYPDDPWQIRWTVWSLLALDTVHVSLSWHMTYYYLILNFNNPPELDELTWSFNVTVVLTAMITAIAHSFYARRLHILSDRNWFVTSLILLLSLLRLVMGCVVSAKIFQIKQLRFLAKKIGSLVCTELGAGTIADWVITAMLIFYLQRHKSGFNTTDHLLDKISFWTVSNGMLTSIVGVVVVVTFITIPNSMVFLAVHLLLSKLYANSLLATLNCREANRGHGLNTVVGSFALPGNFHIDPEMPPIEFNSRGTGHSQTNSVSSSARSGSGPVVHIVTTSSMDREFPPTPSGKSGQMDDGEGELYPRVGYDIEGDLPTSSGSGSFHLE